MHSETEMDAPPPASPMMGGGKRSWTELCHAVVAGMMHPMVAWTALAGLVLALFILPPAGIGFSTCSMKSSTGVPCPGCGLTRSVTSVFHGRFLAAWQLNPFGFGFAFLFAVLAPLSLLPGKARHALRERALRYQVLITVVLGLFLVGLIGHGLVRAALVQFDHPAYAWWKQGDNPPALVEQP